MPVINCPHCQKPIEWDSNNPHRPFCSERCRLIDLGAWANEEYQISKPSGTEVAMDPEEAEELLHQLEQAAEPPLH
ncbi:DNA gyrase inhibitor YacG [Motiliproteus sp.]|uniref:DNA gyrase inhibitor YacG n=1 Tax=Motiliproteus sp. TaxID=1898955 RepID=UPI003BA9577A